MEPSKLITLLCDSQHPTSVEGKISGKKVIPDHHLKTQKERMENTIKYIQAKRDPLIEETRMNPKKSIYFRPKARGMKREEMFNFNVSIDKYEKERIFILQKTELLGEGKSKIVFSGLDYHSVERIGCAWVKSSEDFQTAYKEFLIQQEHGEAYACCQYTLIKESEEKEKMLIIMPEYNLGNLRSWTELNSPHNFSTEPSTIQVVRQMIRNILSVIQRFHDAGIILVDVKPENLLLHENENGIRVGFNDFGLSYLHGEENTYPFGGSPLYASPEVVRANHNYAELYDEYDDLIYELKLYSKGSHQYNETVEEMNDLALQMENIINSLSFPRDVYSTAISISQLLQNGHPPSWIKPALDWFPEAYEYMIDPDRYEKSYLKFASSINGDKENPTLEYILYHMSDPNPETRWTMDKSLEELNKIDWESDPIIYEESY